MLVANKVTELFTLKSANKRAYHRDPSMSKAENTPIEKNRFLIYRDAAKFSSSWLQNVPLNTPHYLACLLHPTFN